MTTVSNWQTVGIVAAGMAPGTALLLYRVHRMMKWRKENPDAAALLYSFRRRR